MVEVEYDPQYFMGYLDYDEVTDWVPPAGPASESESSIPFPSHPTVFAWFLFCSCAAFPLVHI